MNLKNFGYPLFLIAVSAQDESLSLGKAAGGDDCKVVETVENFDIGQYASAPWYIHQQAETRYSPLSQNYCTRAQYSILESESRLGYSVSVYNEAQDSNENDFGGPLCAYQDEDTLSKLAVAPCFLPKFFAGPYWVVAYDENEGYALISGGQPKIAGDNGGCKTGTGINNAGLWIFSRSQDRDDELIAKVRSIAADAGFDLSVLNDVVQDDCKYKMCADQVDTFRVWYGAQKDCDWVNSFSTFRCVFYDDHCPETCGRCPVEI